MPDRDYVPTACRFNDRICGQPKLRGGLAEDRLDLPPRVSVKNQKAHAVMRVYPSPESLQQIEGVELDAALLESLRGMGCQRKRGLRFHRASRVVVKYLNY